MKEKEISTLNKYSLCPKLLVAEMDVSRTKKHLDTSIPATGNSGRREYTTSINGDMYHLSLAW